MNHESDTEWMEHLLTFAKVCVIAAGVIVGILIGILILCLL